MSGPGPVHTVIRVLFCACVVERAWLVGCDAAEQHIAQVQVDVYAEVTGDVL
jgi:hypothetical protein